MFMGSCFANIFQYMSNKMQLYTLYLYLETVLHIPGVTSTHYQERIQLYLCLISVLFDVHGSVHRKYILIYIQQNATLHALFISGNCSTYFGCYSHPLSGAHTTVSTPSCNLSHRYCLDIYWNIFAMHGPMNIKQDGYQAQIQLYALLIMGETNTRNM
jgi:hypothetical protein